MNIDEQIKKLIEDLEKSLIKYKKTGKDYILLGYKSMIAEEKLLIKKNEKILLDLKTDDDGDSKTEEILKTKMMIAICKKNIAEIELKIHFAKISKVLPKVILNNEQIIV